uniref:Uncharacterized protein n=1 Tax=Anguilla anguilla TaxID=7936 RepID=A0A0E9XSR6_ANGAN
MMNYAADFARFCNLLHALRQQQMLLFHIFENNVVKF